MHRNSKKKFYYKNLIEFDSSYTLNLLVYQSKVHDNS